MGRVHEDDFGILWCTNCSTELTCDENGELPAICPDCGEALDWARYKAEQTKE